MNDNSNPAPESSRENYRLTFSGEREKKEMLMIFFSPLSNYPLWCHRNFNTFAPFPAFYKKRLMENVVHFITEIKETDCDN